MSSQEFRVKKTAYIQEFTKYDIRHFIIDATLVSIILF